MTSQEISLLTEKLKSLHKVMEDLSPEARGPFAYVTLKNLVIWLEKYLEFGKK